MALSIIGTPGAANASSIALPTHAIGDIIIIFAFRSNSTTVPTKPAAGGTVPAWVDIDAPAGSNGASARSAQFVATATNHTSGTWTNATSMAVIVVRGQAASPIGGHALTGGAAADQAVAPAVTLSQSNGTSMILEFYGQGNGSSSLGAAWDGAPAGYTRRASAGTAFDTTRACLNTKNVTTSDGSITQTGSTTGLSTGYRGATIEILAAPVPTNMFFPAFRRNFMARIGAVAILQGIQFKSSAGANSTTISSMPAHAAGDLLLMWAYNSSGSTPSLAGGWTNIDDDGAAFFQGGRVAYKFAASSSETSGSWSNAENLICAVYSGVASIGAHSISRDENDDATSTYPALTLDNTDGTSWVVMYTGIDDANVNATTTAGSHPRRHLQAGVDGDAAIFDTNGTVSSWSGDNSSKDDTQPDISGSIELRAFTAFNEENVNQTNQPVPVGVSGAWVTLIGGGGGGGSGMWDDGFAVVRYGGGGGGGAAKIPRIFIPAASLGATYSVTRGSGGTGGPASSLNVDGNDGMDGGASSFVSGSTTLTAGGGLKGLGGTESTGTGGAGGVAIGSGGINGTAGGNSSTSGTAGAGTNNISGGGAGGGAGGGRSAFGDHEAGGDGGDTLTQSGGAGAAVGNGPGQDGPVSAAGVAAPGGGGGSAESPDDELGREGGDALGYGGGGGGGAANEEDDGNTCNNAGGSGGPGYVLIEWV